MVKMFSLSILFIHRWLHKGLVAMESITSSTDLDAVIMEILTKRQGKT